MKHLKKILIVIAMLALLLVSFATVIGAEEDANTGSVLEIEKHITKIESELAKPDDDTSKRPDEKISAAYDYLHDPSVIWDGVSETEEYKTAVAKLDGYCVQYAASQAAKATVANDVNTVYAFIAKCGPSEETEGYAELVAEITAKNEGLVEALFEKYVAPALKLETTDPETGEAIEPTPEQIATAHATLYTDMNSARTALKNVFKQLKKCPWVSTEASAKYNEAAQQLITLMLDEYDYFLTVATDSDTDYYKKVNDIRTVEAFAVDTVTVAEMSEDDLARMNAGLKGAEDAIAAKRKTLDEEAPFEEYDLGYYMQKYYEEDFADTGDALPAYNAKNAHKSQKLTETIYGYNKATGKYEERENSYTNFTYGSSEEIHLYTAFLLSKAQGMSEYGIVVEWDMRVNDTNAHTITFQDEDRVRTDANGYAVFKNLFDYSAGNDNFIKVKQSTNGSYAIVNIEDKDRKSVENAIVTDVWTHYTVTFDPETRIGYFYINYALAFEVYHFDFEKLQSQFRFGPSKVAGWEGGWDIDNLELYYGTAFRITDKFSSMTPAQQFEYYVNYAYDGMGRTEEYLARNSAYNKAKLMANSYGKDDDIFKKFKEIEANYDAWIKRPAMEQNLGILTEKVEKLKDIAVITDNKTKIADAIKDINAFVSKNGSLIDKADTSDTGYQAQMAIVYSTEADVKKLELLESFVAAIEKFERATTLSARTRYALAAAEIYAQAEYDIEENRNFVIERNDPVVIAFEKKLNNQVVTNSDGTTSYLQPTDDKGNPTPGYLAEDDPAYVKLFAYYESFESILVAREKLENSKNIINAMKAVTGMNGYAATDEFFAANYEELKTYTLLVRGYISTANYDAEYDGVEEALEAFYEMDPYFYERLQAEHIETLTAMIAKYDAVNTFIEKVAIVNSVKAYIENEDTALNNDTIKKAVRMRIEDEYDALVKLQSQNEVYENELKGYEESYLDVLTQQTEYFINIINHMDSVVTFSEIEDLFAEASVYYYGINLNVEGALEAAEKYADYRAYIASVNENNDTFTMYLKNLTAILNDEDIVGVEKRDELFSTLKSLSTYADFVDTTNKNIVKGLEMYYAELAAYESGISAVDSAIYQANQFANALRTNKLPATVLSVIGKLINN